MRWMLVAALIFATSTGLARTAAAGQLAYLSLGDSVGFGESDFMHNPSDGDRGYVSLFAQTIAARNGGVAPQVINLAVDGETSSSFSSASGRVPPVAGISDATLAGFNTHYAANTAASQDSMMLGAIRSELAKGDTIGNVTISLGANDLFALALSPAFNAPSADQPALLAQALGILATNYGGLLAELKMLAPGAQVALIGEYNPFPATPGSPLAGFAAPAIQGLNGVIQGLAKQFGASYVDTYTPFVGHEAAYTHIVDMPGNVHPDDIGYSVIAAQITAATVPEPASLALLGLGVGLATLAARARGPRRAA